MNDRLAIDGGTPVRSTPLPTVADISGRDFGEEEMTNIQEVMRTGKLFMYDGHFVTQFEDDFAKLMGMKHAVACTSGTAALHIAVGTINPNPGDEIITAPITDMGTLIGILLQNCIPVFRPRSGDVHASPRKCRVAGYGQDQGDFAGSPLRPSRRYGPADGYR